MAAQKKSSTQATRSDPARTEATRPAASAIPLSDISAEALAHLKRPRMGFEWHFDTLIGLAASTPMLRPRGFDQAQLTQDLLAYRGLEAEEERAARHLARVKATRLERSARVWAAMMDIYARTRAAARSDEELAGRIADFQAFMKLGPRTKKTP